MATRAALARTCKQLHSIIERDMYRDNIRQNGGWVMGWAAVHGRLGTLQKAMASGADIHAEYLARAQYLTYALYSSTKIPARQPLLHYAAKSGQDNIVEFLLDHKVDINKKPAEARLCGCMWSTSPPRRFPRTCSRQWAPLHLAICQGNTSTARLLLRRGAIPESDTRQSMVERRLAVCTAIACDQLCLVGDIVRDEIDLVPMREIHASGAAISILISRYYHSSGRIWSKEQDQAVARLGMSMRRTRYHSFSPLIFEGDTNLQRQL